MGSEWAKRRGLPWTSKLEGAEVKNITQSDVDRIIDILFANKMISETNNTITYAF